MIHRLLSRAGWSVSVPVCIGLLAAEAGLAAGAPAQPLSQSEKQRMVVMTDIGGDPDDEQSIVRFLLHACDFEVEGLCTGFGHGHYKVTHPELIRKAVDAYGQVLPNLLQHRPDYPSHAQLVALIKDGSNGDPHSVGPGRDSEASDWIIRVVDRDDPRPVWFSIWGGPRELAQAIWKVRETRSAEQLAAFKRKIRVHSIADQDRTALWVKENHPDVFWIFSDGQFRGIWREGDQSIVSSEWLEANVRAGHGALGAVYPAKASGKAGVKEGDTPSFLYLLPNGLSDPEQPGWGNWGGRFEPSGLGKEFVSAQDIRNGAPDMLYPVHRWRTAYQNEFEARADWCVKPYETANHAPSAVLNGDAGRRALEIEADPGGVARLSAAGSTDPDGGALRFRWWIYVEAGTYWAAPPIQGAETEAASIRIPPDASGRTIHVILEAIDEGKPPLTAYRRAILKVRGRPLPLPPGVQARPAEALPSPGEFVPVPAGPWKLLRAVNVNGKPVEIDGQRWEGGDAPDFACNGKPLTVADLKLQPPADTGRQAMLTDFKFDRNLQVALRNLPAGTYAVFVYIVEDNRSENLSFWVEGRPVLRNYASGPAGQWRRLGPWMARVIDGALDLRGQGGAANLSGIELWKR
ncbi:MAG TPA: DUF1593 domain-containing protein [Candidatus Paceibacterota bacterium]|nr:DUF1593 domain-containing protein [Verrucomicrobiota bacterium]HRZ44366.1 DUF1593 domain-containing protein [Candidatus Paceibacterota bacterium]